MFCALCGSKKSTVIRKRLRHDMRRDVLRCDDCGLIFLKPKGSMTSFYRKEYRKRHSPIIGKAMSGRELFEFSLPLQKERIEGLKHILKPSFRILDVGSSSGHFVYAIKNKVKECVGIELNTEYAGFTQKELGIKVYNQPIEKCDLPEKYFDLITVYHTFEHIQKPLPFLEAVYKCLKPNGYLFVEVPNTNDALMSVYGLENFADFWYIEPHSFFYTPETLKKTLKKAGFSGSIKTAQSFNFINHINWILTGKPQPDWKIATSMPKLVNSDSRPKIKRELNRWMAKIDKEYREILNKHKVGGNIVFLGKKKVSNR